MSNQRELEDCRLTAALYALGSLPETDREQFRARVRSGCPVCNAALSEFAETAAYLAMSVPSVEPPSGLRERVLNIAKRGAAAGRREMTVIRRNESEWLQSPVPGVHMRPLLGDKTVLVRMQPGAVYPKHEHRETEQCYVLEGSITDSDGVTVHAGDFVCMSADTVHRPIHTDTGCTFLITYTN
jgi:mannose-6-phosphate isomerase-like protein (cupin superfamily)